MCVIYLSKNNQSLSEVLFEADCWISLGGMKVVILEVGSKRGGDRVNVVRWNTTWNLRPSAIAMEISRFARYDVIAMRVGQVCEGDPAYFFG